MEIIPQLLLVIILVLLNGFFVASEFALVSVRRTRIKILVKQNNRSAKLVQKSINNLNTFISSTQLGITLASLALGWVGEPALAHFLEPFFRIFLSTHTASISANALSITIAFSLITFLHIVIGELVPKSIALQKSERTSLLLITPLTLFTTVFKPFIWILNRSGILVLKIIGFSAPLENQLVHSEEEIKMILAQSVEQGAIEKGEAEMVYSVFKFGDIPVKKIMIPRNQIVSIELNTPMKEVIKVSQNNQHSRFPVYKNSLNNVIGFIHVKDVYRELIRDSRIELIRGIYRNIFRRDYDTRILQEDLVREILKFPDDARIDDILLIMRKKRIHIAIVTKYRKTTGLVTLEDIVENIVGEIHDEFEKNDK